MRAATQSSWSLERARAGNAPESDDEEEESDEEEDSDDEEEDNDEGKSSSALGSLGLKPKPAV